MTEWAERTNLPVAKRPACLQVAAFYFQSIRVSVLCSGKFLPISVAETPRKAKAKVGIESQGAV